MSAPNFSEKLDYDLSNSYRQSDEYKMNRDLVDRVNDNKPNRDLVYESILHPHTGDAFLVKAGQVIQMEHMFDRAQVVDWLFITPDLEDVSSMGNSVCFDGFWLKKYYQVMSGAGRMKTMVTMIRDDTDKTKDEWGPSERWGRHIWIYHCSPEWQEMFYPKAKPHINCCHMNFVHGFNRVPAIAEMPDGPMKRSYINHLAASHNFQTFQIMDIDYKADEEQMKIMLGECGPVKKGDGLEFYANTDVYVIASSCPYGDFSSPVWGEKAKLPDPLQFRVFETGIQPPPPRDWRDWDGAFYEMVESGHKDISPRTAESYAEKPDSGPNGTEIWLPNAKS